MLFGVALKVLSAFAFTVMNAVVKAEGDTFPIGEIMFFRSIFALPTLIGWLVMIGAFPSALATRRPFGHVLRGVAGTIGMSFGFAAVSVLPLPEAVGISYVTPLVVVVLAALVLRERVRAYRWSAVAVGFCGVLVMLSDQIGAVSGGGADRIGVTFALLAAAFAAVAAIQTRRLTLTEETGAIVFYFTATTAIVSALSYPLGFVATPNPVGAMSIVAPWRLPHATEFLALASVGLVGGVGQILLTQCYRYGDASVMAAFDYTSMIWAASIGYVAFNEPPTLAIALGAVLVTVAGLFVIWRETRLGLLRAPLVKSAPSNPV